MYHVDAVLKSDADDVILSEVRPDRRQPLPHEITLITLVSMRSHAVFVRVDGDCGHGELMSGSEDADGNLPAIGDEDLLEWTSMTGLLAPKGLDTVHYQ